MPKNVRPMARLKTPLKKAPSRDSKSGSKRLYLRLGLFALIVIVVGIAAFTLLRPPSYAESAGALPVRIDMAGFEPKTMNVKAGTPIKLRLINPDSAFHTDGGGKHQFAIPELGVDAVVQPKSEQVISFTPTKPGAYTFYCDICCGGKENPSMQGTLTVDS